MNSNLCASLIERWECNKCGDVDALHAARNTKHEVTYTWSYTEDRFTNTNTCVERLLKEYAHHPQLIVATDFDDTVYDFHGKGFTHPAVLETLRRASKAGFYIVILTASAPHRFDEMRDFLAKESITVHSVNENPIELPYGKHGKPYYNILLDDRAGLGQALETLKAVLDKVEAIGDGKGHRVEHAN